MSASVPASSNNRWQRILQVHDEKTLWRAIDWKENFNANPLSAESRPSDDAFKEHLEELLLSEGGDELADPIDSYVTVPILDSAISPMEVDYAIRGQLKSDKCSGPDGISPSLIKVLPVRWIP